MCYCNTEAYVAIVWLGDAESNFLNTELIWKDLFRLQYGSKLKNKLSRNENNQ